MKAIAKVLSTTVFINYLDNWFNFKRKFEWFLFLRSKNESSDTLQSLVENTLFDTLGWRRYFIPFSVLLKMRNALVEAASQHYNRPDVARIMRLLFARTACTEQEMRQFLAAYNQRRES